MTSSEKIVLKRELQQALSQVLRGLREKLPHKPSQEEMGAAIGMDRSYWGDLERGERSPTLFNLWRMALALDVSPWQLVRAVDKRYQQIRKGTTTLHTPVEEVLKQWRDFIDLSPEMKWMSDPHQKITYANQVLLDYLGVAFAGVEGFAWQELIHPEDRKKQLAQNKAGYANEEAFLSRYRIRRNGNEFAVVVQNAAPLRTHKKFLGMMGTIIPEPPSNSGETVGDDVSAPLRPKP